MTASPEKVTWNCPYCDESGDTLRGIQQHITETTTGDHEGISGESPDEDIVATDEDGDEVDVYEAADVVRPKDAPLQGVSKRKQVVYAYLANDREEDPDALAEVTEADRDYALQILGQIRRGEITRDYWADDTDRRLLAAMKDRLEEYDPTDNNESESESEAAMSTQQQTDADAEESTGEVPEDVTSKTLVLNAYDLTGPDVTVKKVWEAMTEVGVFDSGYEYFRRTWKEARDGDITEDELESAVDDQIQSVLEHVLFEADLLEQATTESDVITDGEEEPVQADTPVAEPSASVESARSTSRIASEGGVPVEAIEDVQEKVALLREQAEYEGQGDDSAAARRAEFFGKKVDEWLSELIEQAEQ